jgi:hypothetical protein
MVEVRGLVGVIMGRGSPERDKREVFRGCTLGLLNMVVWEEEPVAEAAMSLSLSSVLVASWSARWGVK